MPRSLAALGSEASQQRVCPASTRSRLLLRGSGRSGAKGNRGQTKWGKRKNKGKQNYPPDSGGSIVRDVLSANYRGGYFAVTFRNAFLKPLGQVTTPLVR